MKTIKVPEAKQLPSGAWRCRVMANGASRSFTAPTKNAAERAALEFKRGETKLPIEKETLRVKAQQYIDKRRDSLSPSTIRGYNGFLSQYYQDILDIPIRNLSESACQRSISTLAKTHAPKTVKNSWAFLASVLKKECGINFDVHLPTIVRNEKDFLQPEEIKLFLKAIEGNPFEIGMLLALHGLRRSEIYGLTWKNVDLNKNLLHIHGSAVMNERGELVHKKANKNASSRRTVPIMIARLSKLLSSCPREDDRVVTCNINTLYSVINRVCMQNDLPQIGVHGLRHSFCSLAFHLGFPEELTMQLGGWSDHQTMRKIYTHLAKSDVEKRVTAMCNFFSP